MKLIKTTVFMALLIAAFACSQKKDKKENISIPSIGNVKPEKSSRIESEYKSRESIIKEIVTTSPRYKQLTTGLYEAVIKNGGLSIGISLEGSPDSKLDKIRNYSKTYDYTLYEMYPNRRLNTTRFSFNPQNNQLYEYDAVNEQLMLIEFDKDLLIKYAGFVNSN